ncbi:MAG TPA: hypothetical protein VF544_19635 [Pyrinomonadaceae bacterium]
MVSSAPSHRRSDPDPEMKAILDDLRGRSMVRHELLEGDGEAA